MPQNEQPTLLICTVGGSPEPVVASIRYWRPSHAVFVVSPRSKEDVGLIISEASAAPGGVPLSTANTENLELTDEQHTERCVAEIAPLQRRISQWMAGKSGRKVVVDFTGGTKCMSAAVAIVAARTDCTFSYVGSRNGASGRDRKGTGVVKAGNEVVVSQFNPWKSLGYEVYEDAALLFNQHLYTAAEGRLKLFYERLPKHEPLREQFEVLWHFVRGYGHWDRFEHAAALSNIRAAENGLGTPPDAVARAVRDVLPRHRSFLTALHADPCGHEFFSTCWRTPSGDHSRGDMMTRWHGFTARWRPLRRRHCGSRAWTRPRCGWSKYPRRSAKIGGRDSPIPVRRSNWD